MKLLLEPSTVTQQGCTPTRIVEMPVIPVMGEGNAAISKELVAHTAFGV